MIWFALLIVALAVLGLLNWRGLRNLRLLALSAIAMLVGLLGYGLQGQPQLRGAPVHDTTAAASVEDESARSSAPATDSADSISTDPRIAAMFADLPKGPLAAEDIARLRERLGAVDTWPLPAPLLTEILISQGRAGLAVSLAQAGLVDAPDDVELWVALGNALVAHGGDVINPAAQLAFDKAARRNPDHPAPPFFAGLAFAQSGDLATAEALWSDLLERSQADAPWRTDLTQRLAILRRQRALIAQAQAQQAETQ